MKLSMQIPDAQVNDMELTIHITMKVREWREVYRNQPSNPQTWNPASELGFRITECLGHIARATQGTFETKEKDILARRGNITEGI